MTLNVPGQQVFDEARRVGSTRWSTTRQQKNLTKRVIGIVIRVECVGNTIHIWLNGIPCANLVDDMTASGPIASGPCHWR